MNNIKITEKDKEINDKLYQEYEKLKMEDGWNTGDKNSNYHKLIKIAEYAKATYFNATILDVGCGTGDLSAFLREKNIKSYIGIDIYAPAIIKAKNKYPTEEFILGDVLNDALPRKKYDFVFCSGALTTKLATDNYEFLEAILGKMWSLTKKGLVFNMLTDEDEDPDQDLFSYNREKVIAICQKVAPSAKIQVEKNSHFFQTHIYLF